MSKSKTYYSFEDIGVEVFGMKPFNKRTNDKEKLESQREKFEGTCPYCGQRAKFILGTNIIACVNPQCKGKKIVIKGDPATEEPDYVKYQPYSRILSEKGAEIGNILFE